MDKFLVLMKEEHLMFTKEDDQKMLTLIENTHAHASRVVDVEPLLQLIIDILKPSCNNTSKAGDTAHSDPVRYAMDSLKKKISSDKVFEGLAKDIHTISCKISCKCTGEGGGDKNTVSVLIETMSSYSWEAKVVLVMAAFAVTYGGLFFSLRKVGTENWKKLQKLGEELIPTMVNLTNSFIKAHKMLPPEFPLSSEADQETVYWTIRSVVACVPHIFGFLGLGHEYTPSEDEDKELRKLIGNLDATNGKIQAKLKLHEGMIEKKTIFEYRQKLELLFRQTSSTDNKFGILKQLFGVKDDKEQPLFNIFTGNSLGVEAVAKKTVLLLVSWELTIESEEIGILVDMYKKTTIQADEYELVCFPMRTPEKTQREKFVQHVREKFEQHVVGSKKLSWYLVEEHHDRLINQAVVEYIQDEWHFHNRPILAVLNAEGKLINKNAFHNIRIFGGSSTTLVTDLSITIKTVEECWSTATWGLGLLFQSIKVKEATQLLEWTTDDNQLICLYGGEDTAWVENFEKKALEVVGEFKVKMAYMGARNQTKKVQQKFSEEIEIQSRFEIHWSQSQELASQFWVQLESMEQFRTEFIIAKKGSIDEEKDDIIKGIRSLLTYDSSEKGWAMICQGSKIVAQAKGDVILDCFGQYTKWKDANPTKGIKECIKVLIDYVNKYDHTTHCNRLMVPLNNGKIPKDIRCENCPKLMQKFIMYRCCDD